jgi:sporulation protein YlmC with PRC-barrel domain
MDLGAATRGRAGSEEAGRDGACVASSIPRRRARGVIDRADSGRLAGMLIEDETLRAKKVLTLDGRHVGEVTGLEIELDGWRVQWLDVKLLRDVLEGLKVKKPLFGSVTIRLAPERVRAVTDNVMLTTDFDKLASLLAGEGDPGGVELKK